MVSTVLNWFDAEVDYTAAGDVVVDQSAVAVVTNLMKYFPDTKRIHRLRVSTNKIK